LNKNTKPIFSAIFWPATLRAKLINYITVFIRDDLLYEIQPSYQGVTAVPAVLKCALDSVYV